MNLKDFCDEVGGSYSTGENEEVCRIKNVFVCDRLRCLVDEKYTDNISKFFKSFGYETKINELGTAI